MHPGAQNVISICTYFGGIENSNMHPLTHLIFRLTRHKHFRIFIYQIQCQISRSLMLTGILVAYTLFAPIQCYLHHIKLSKWYGANIYILETYLNSTPQADDSLMLKAQSKDSTLWTKNLLPGQHHSPASYSTAYAPKHYLLPSSLN